MENDNNPYQAPRTPLVPRQALPDMDLVTIGSFRFLPEADALRLHLEEQGIQAFLLGGLTTNADYFLGSAIGFIKIQVPIDQAAQARKIFEETEALWKEQRDAGMPVRPHA